MARPAKIMSLVCCAAAVAGIAACALRGAPAPRRDGSTAQAAWKEFSGKLSDEHRQNADLLGERLGPVYSAQFTSPQLERLLPGFTFYVLRFELICREERHAIGGDTFFAVSPEGKIAGLGDGQPVLKDDLADEVDFPSLTGFLGSAGIAIKSAEDAIDAVKIIYQFNHIEWEKLDEGEGVPVKGASVVSMLPDEDWRFKVVQEGDKWVVYRVDSAAFPWPIIFGFTVDDQGVLQSVKPDGRCLEFPESPSDPPRPIS